MITPEALRAARSLLNWGVRDLAAASNVAWTTISQYENGRIIRDSTALKLIATLEAQGIELVTNQEATGAILVYAKRGGVTDG